MRLLKGITHVHTTYSHDSEISLERLAAICRVRGIDFALISDHAQDLDEESFSRLICNASQYSTNDILLIPGLEYESEKNVHLLAYGLSSFIDPTKKLTEIAALVKERGGLNIIAHPKRNGYSIQNDLLKFLDGVEIWNAKIDGSFAPNTKSLSLLRSLRVNNPKMFGYSGLDLHWDKQKIMVFINVLSGHLQKASLFRALQEGNFLVSNTFFSIKPNGNGSVIYNSCFVFMNVFNTSITLLAKIIYNNLKKILGNKIGCALKRYSRRFLY